MITVNQEIYRAYLHTPLWAQKRSEALLHYGKICNRCKSEGTDVHHKTYKRVGGDERMSDLEILCRACHDAHHRVERSDRAKKKSKVKRIHFTAAYRYMTKKQIEIINTKLNTNIYISRFGSNDFACTVRNEMMKILGKNFMYGIPFEDYTCYQKLGGHMINKIKEIRQKKPKRKKR